MIVSRAKVVKIEGTFSKVFLFYSCYQGKRDFQLVSNQTQPTTLFGSAVPLMQGVGKSIKNIFYDAFSEQKLKFRIPFPPIALSYHIIITML